MHLERDVNSPSSTGHYLITPTFQVERMYVPFTVLDDSEIT